MGLLKIDNAVLDTASFWNPATGKGSDADTLKVNVGNAKFTFQPLLHLNAQDVKSLFQGKHVKGNETELCIKDGLMSVRLQGIDCPELGYNAPGLGGKDDKLVPAAQREEYSTFNHRFRQRYATLAIKALADFLRNGAAHDVVHNVRIESFLDLPGDAFDARGRLVGDVFVSLGGKEVRLNDWLVKQGWAFPLYYESMMREEIDRLNAAWNDARTHKRNLASFPVLKVPRFDHLMRKGNAPAGDQPGEAPAWPKLFRRQVEWWVRSQAGLEAGGLPEYLARKDEGVMTTEEFLQYGRAATKRSLAEFVDADGVLQVDPSQLVFYERDATLMDGKDEVTSWSEDGSVKLAWKQTISENKNEKWLDWVNSVAINSDGTRIAAATFRHDYRAGLNDKGKYVLKCFNKGGLELATWPNGGKSWKWDGVFSVALNEDGSIVAAGGLSDVGEALLCAYDVGTKVELLNCKTLRKNITSVSLSKSGDLLVAGGEAVYAFHRNGGRYVQLEGESAMLMDGDVRMVAVHPTDEWLVACGATGRVLFAELKSDKTINKNKVRTWRVPMKPIDRRRVNSRLAPVPLLCVAIAGGGEQFAVGGGDEIYLFTRSGMLATGGPAEPLVLDTWDSNAAIGKKEGGMAENVRWLAMNSDGTRLAAAVNRRIGGQDRGLLMAFENLTGTWGLRWSQLRAHPINGVSLDGPGDKIAVADGFPQGSPGSFSLLDWSGAEHWHYDTKDMNWPIALSPDGKRIAAGSDDGKVYCFTP